jgi:methionyl-tRNA synthetase
MAEQHLDAPVTVPEQSIPQAFFEVLDHYEFNEACEIVWREIAACDLLIQETQPFKIVKEDAEKGKAIIADLAVRLYTIGRMLNPLMPATSAAIKAAVKVNKKPENLFARKD